MAPLLGFSAAPVLSATSQIAKPQVVATRLLNATEISGIRGMLVHAISDDARTFYEAVGFRRLS